MSQYDILEFLKKNKKEKFTVKQIGILTGINNVGTKLTRLRRRGMVNSEEIKLTGNYGYKYWYKK